MLEALESNLEFESCVQFIRKKALFKEFLLQNALNNFSLLREKGTIS